MGSGKGCARLKLELHPKQQLAFYSPATDLLYGGAAGGGKSYLARVGAIMWASMIPHLQVFIFRKTFDDLIKNHMEGSMGFRQMLFPWTSTGLARIVETEIRFHFNGSKIFLAHCQYDDDRWKYQGYEMHVLFLEEAGQFSEITQRFLCSRVRMPQEMQDVLPEQYRGLFPRIVRTANPGGEGHDYLRREFVHSRPALAIERARKEEGGRLRQYIPAQLADNPSLNREEYEGALMQLGDAELVRAMLDGDWDAILGSFFGSIWYDWRKRGGIVKPFKLPQSWVRARSFDWGSARPFSVGWWAVANGEQSEDDGAPTIPRGAVVRYREWYGASKPNVGLDLSPQEVARGILERQADGEDALVSYSVADPSIFSNSKRDWGVDIAEEMAKAGVRFSPADNKRVAGWQQMRQRMQGEDGKPMLYVFDTCSDFQRTLPVLPREEANWEDIDTSAEDHCFAGGTEVVTMDGVKRIDEMPSTGYVWTTAGWQQYRNCRSYGEQEAVTVHFEDGSRVVCTPDHRFREITAEGWQWTEAKDLCKHGLSRIAVSLPSVADSAETGLAVTRTSKAGRCEVFCLDVLTISKNFALANGAIVHNCADEARYYCNSRPWFRVPKKMEPIKHIGNVTVAELFKIQDQEAGRTRHKRARIA